MTTKTSKNARRSNVPVAATDASAHTAARRRDVLAAWRAITNEIP